MARKYNSVGGGIQTNINGLSFERDTDLLAAFEKESIFKIEIIPSKYKTRTAKIFFQKDHIGYFYEKQSLYRDFFLKKHNIDFDDEKYSLLEPDNVFINLKNKTAYIIEKKFQSMGGSVDEKLQTCDYKKNHFYKPKFKKIGYETQFYFLLSDFFDDEKKSDVFDYVKNVGCRYFFKTIPLPELGIEL
jgi:hypothetical protein